jgi:glucose/arabinose dehydrogenase
MWPVALAICAVPATVHVQQNSPGGLRDEPIVVRTALETVRVTPIKGLVYPWALAILPDGDMLVTEQGRNTLRRIRQGKLDPAPITGLPQGITSTRRDTAGVEIILHPKFSENRLIYVAYWKPTAADPRVRTAAVVRARYDGGSALQDVQEIFVSDSRTDGPSAARLVFGADGKIYLGLGAPGFNERVGTANDAQDPGSHLGKILRLNDDGTTPGDNPFVKQSGYKPEIFALGIRNAIGLTLHPDTGEVWETENGPQGGDEINIIRAGQNYGWPIITYGRAYTSDTDGKQSGLPPPSVQPPTSKQGMAEPLTYYKPSLAIAGMVFYKGTKFRQWQGHLIIGALGGMQLSRVQFTRQNLEVRREAMLLDLRQRIRDVREGADGFLYVTTDMRDGAVLKLEPAAEP